MNPTKSVLATILIVISSFPILAQGEVIFNNIKMGDSLSQVVIKLDSIAEKSKIFSIKETRFPLAKLKEEHLVYLNIKTEYGKIDKAVFTFADNSLKYIEAKGNAVNVFESSIKDSASTYLDYQVYIPQKVFLKKAEDIVWVLSNKAMHINLFTWNNPYLSSLKDMPAKNNKEPNHLLPTFIKMGTSLQEIKPLFKNKCKIIDVKKLDGSDPNAQLQIDCFGLNYLGFPRKVEARFGNETLNVVWILTGKGEEDRIRKALIKQFGKPIFVNKDWEIFNDWQVGLRKDKTEVLLMEKSLGKKYKKSYFKQ